MIERAGTRVIVANSFEQVAALAAKAEIVQFEFWNHPRMFECLARCDFPAMRSVFWSHISGLFKPLIPLGLIEESARFVFTTPASRGITTLSELSEGTRSRISVINSGFGFPPGLGRVSSERPATVAYLGTVDFLKMRPCFFDCIDDLGDDAIRVAVWGALDRAGPVAARAQAMRHPERIVFHGQSDEPARALGDAGIFFYPLQPDHYGTAENVLIEAMSLGLVPVVMNNAAELAIVRHGETGFVGQTAEECTNWLKILLSSPHLRTRMSRNAIDHVAHWRVPAQSARDFMTLWLGLLARPKRQHDFRAAIGTSPADWFLATQGASAMDPKALASAAVRSPSKGTLAHFESVFADDTSLRRLRA
ncbi:MAG TPA: glycosyltransferase [Candidatus Binataceae bacterium]|nr:glycosyltransferase [Candidatus Binataceae bacterium]